MNRREFCASMPLLLAGCGYSAEAQMAEYELQQSPVRTGYRQGAPLPGYGQGSWTPVVKLGGFTTGITYTTQLGDYIRYGDMVFVRFLVTLSSKGTAVGGATIDGLPFPGRAGDIDSTLAMYWSAMTSSLVHLVGIIVSSNLDSVSLYGATAAATGVTQLQDNDLSNTTQLGGSGFYLA